MEKKTCETCNQFKTINLLNEFQMYDKINKKNYNSYNCINCNFKCFKRHIFKQQTFCNCESDTPDFYINIKCNQYIYYEEQGTSTRTGTSSLKYKKYCSHDVYCKNFEKSTKCIDNNYIYDYLTERKYNTQNYDHLEFVKGRFELENYSDDDDDDPSFELFS
jgi:hypothetical protein